MVYIRSFSQKKKLKFRQVLIKFSEYETKEQARAVAESLLQKLRAGASFEKLAQENSRDPYAREGGLWASGEFVTQGTVLHQLDDVLFKLPVNEISSLVETPQGYHILRVEEIKPARIIPFEEAQDDIRRALTEQRWMKRYNEYLAELKSKAYIEMK